MRESKAFFYIALLVLYSSWLPLKSISYIVPLGAIVVYVLLVPKKKNLFLFVIYIGFFLIFSAFHSLLSSDFSWISAMLAIVTYSSIAFLFIIKPYPFKVKSIYKDLLPHVQVMTLIQSLWGIVQAIYAAHLQGSFDLDAGDFVEGTIHPAMMSERAFSNPMFAVNIFFLVLFLIPSIRQGDKKSKLLAVLGSLSLILASVVHLLLFIFIAAMLTFFILDIHKLTRGKYFKRLSLVVLIPILLFILQPKNFSLIGKYIVKIVGGELPKVTVTLRSVSVVPEEYPYMPFIGLGPGQFSSRASLIGTGRYIGGHFTSPQSVIPFTEPQMSPAFEDYVLDLWKLSRDFEAYGGGSTAKPFYSWLAIYTEFGLVILVTGLFFLYRFFKKLKLLRRDKERQLMVYLISIGGLVLILLGFMENYWEIPQAILWGIVTLILFFNLTKTEYKLILRNKI